MFLLIFTTVILGFLFYELYWKRRNLPPGPIPLPFIGNLLEVMRNEPGYEAYRKWTKQYGPVHTYWLGSRPMVAVSDYATIQATFIQDADKYAGRFNNLEMTKMYRGGNYGVVETAGDLWRDQRRFTLHTLRDFGMGKNIMEERVMLEVEYLLERREKQMDSFEMQKEFDISVGSIINNILFGYRYDEDKLEEFFFVKGSISQQMKEFMNPKLFLLILYPWLRYLPYFNTACQRLFGYRDLLFNYFRKQIATKEKEFDLDEEPNDFVECFLKERSKRKGTESEEFYSEMQLLNLVFDLWVAGMETTANTLTWGVCYILNHPEVQQKIYQELDEKIKSDRRVEMSDKNNLPYLNAVICEVQRLCNLLPQNLFHATTEDVVINGYSLPKGTSIVPQISCVMYDEKHFPEPYKFDPSRFLNADGSFRRREELIPFSIGKRQCVGEGLARIELFLFLANLFHRFEITATEKPSMKKTFGQTVQAAPYRIFAKNRFAQRQ
ncbi:unnamed protein product, partial [Mesorhabditis spiculigera]